MQADLAQPAHDRLSEWLLFSLIISATILQKIILPVGGNLDLFLGLPLLLVIAATGYVTRRLRVTPVTLLAYAAMAGILCLTQVFASQEISIASLLLLLVVHLPYILTLRPGATRPGIALLFYQRVMFLCAVLGMLQYFGQFAVGAEWAFPMENIVPQSIVAKGFHGMNPIGYASAIYKSNGIFFLEPAMFCQMLAIALVIETVYFHNTRRLAAYLVGIAVTFSGTGLLILFVLAPMYLIAHRRFLVLLLAVLILATAGLWAPAIGLGPTYERAFEFTDPNSSGFARFISIFYVLAAFLTTATKFLFGIGAGTIHDNALPRALGFATFDPSWGKVAFEYGFLGLAAYLGFLLVLMTRSPQSGYLKTALMLQFLFLGEFVLPPTLHAILMALIVWPAIGNDTALRHSGSTDTEEEPHAV